MAIAALGMAAADTIALLSTAATVGSTIYGATQDAPEMPGMPKMEAPSAISKPLQEDPRGRELELAKRKKGRSSTIKTSPLGLGRANVGKKSLLGA